MPVVEPKVVTVPTQTAITFLHVARTVQRFRVVARRRLSRLSIKTAAAPLRRSELVVLFVPRSPDIA